MPRIMKEKFKTYNNVFDQYTIRNLFKLSSEGFFEDLKSAIALGKEANIFTAERKDGSLVIVKIYRLEGCNFNKMFDYIRQDPRYENLSSKKREIIFAWTQREFRNLLKAREVIRVPTPYKVKDNIIVMEHIGDDSPAPELKNMIPKSPKEFLDKSISALKKLYHHGLVHGDISHFNILNHNEEPVLIDFSQATLTRNYHAEELLQRDVNNLAKFFESKCNLKINIEQVLQRIRRKE
ncbi:MAG: serine protein kinase RIO [Candidatus Woesearchaeota archaeon]